MNKENIKEIDNTNIDQFSPKSLFDNTINENFDFNKELYKRVNPTKKKYIFNKKLNKIKKNSKKKNRKK